MKINIIILSFNLLFIISNCFAQEFQNTLKSTNIQSKIKRDSSSGECIFINSFIGKEESFDCCTYPGITCENNHIIKM